METKQLYVVLSRSNTILSSLIHVIKEDEYTHAALALDRNLEYMFSFGRRWANNPFIGCFRREQLDEGIYARHTELPGLVLELSVSVEEYGKVKCLIEEFLLNNHRYAYNYMGLLSGLVGMSGYRQNCFLCSEFVYHVLHQCDICDLERPRSLVRPQDLLRIGGRILYQGNLKHYLPGLSPPIREAFRMFNLAG